MNFEITQKKLSDLKEKFLSNYVNDNNFRNLDSFILIMEEFLLGILFPLIRF